jgi:hypothetical protein
MRLANRNAIKSEYGKNYKRLKKENREKEAQSTNFQNTLKIERIPAIRD